MLKQNMLLVQVGVAALAIVGGGSAAADTATKATTIASATSLDYRVDVTARKSSGGKAPTAEIIVTSYSAATATGSLPVPVSYPESTSGRPSAHRTLSAGSRSHDQHAGSREASRDRPSAGQPLDRLWQNENDLVVDLESQRGSQVMSIWRSKIA